MLAFLNYLFVWMQITITGLDAATVIGYGEDIVGAVVAILLLFIGVRFGKRLLSALRGAAK